MPSVMEAQEKQDVQALFVRRIVIFLICALAAQAIFIALCIFWQADVFTSNKRVSVFPNNLLIAMVIGYAVQFSAVIVAITRLVQGSNKSTDSHGTTSAPSRQPKMSNPYLPPGY